MLGVTREAVFRRPLWRLLILLLQGKQSFSCVPFRGREPRSGEGVLEGKNRKETQSRAGRLSAVTSTVECHIGAWPRTPYGPSRGSEGGRRRIFESYFSCTLPAGPLWWLAPPPFSTGKRLTRFSGRYRSPTNRVRLPPLFRGHYGCRAFELFCVYDDNAGKPYNRPYGRGPAVKVLGREAAIIIAASAATVP